jgi:hypothetical protein
MVANGGISSRRAIADLEKGQSMADVAVRDKNVVADRRSGKALLFSRWFPYSLILFAVASGFAYVYAFGVDVPWADDWCVRPKILSHYAQGTLTWAELWRNHNEHRIFFPELVMLGLGILAHGNVTFCLPYFSSPLENSCRKAVQRG